MKTPDKTLLMIRAYDQAVDFVAELAPPNPVIFAPMVQIEPVNADQTLPAAALVIFTSANAVRLYANKAQHNGGVFCVGSVTTRVAVELGFSISQTFKTAEELVAYFRNTANGSTSILYPRAETISLDIAGELAGMDLQVTEAILYRQTFRPLSDEAMILIESSPTLVPILSKEIAKRFLCAITTLKPHDLMLVCISPSVAAIFADFNVKFAEKPTRAALVKKIKTCLKM